jgi:hypothetical protein
MSLILLRFFRRLRGIEEARWGKKAYMSSTSDTNESSRWKRKRKPGKTDRKQTETPAEQ